MSNTNTSLCTKCITYVIETTAETYAHTLYECGGISTFSPVQAFFKDDSCRTSNGKNTQKKLMNDYSKVHDS